MAPLIDYGCVQHSFFYLLFEHEHAGIIARGLRSGILRTPRLLAGGFLRGGVGRRGIAVTRQRLGLGADPSGGVDRGAEGFACADAPRVNAPTKTATTSERNRCDATEPMKNGPPSAGFRCHFAPKREP
jgi:hypothetical protein